MEPPSNLPDIFFYSEEMILVNSEPGVAESNVRRILSILRTQDTIVVTIREIRHLRASAYYEFYRFFQGKTIDEARNHPLMKPFDQDFFKKTIPREYWRQVAFSSLESQHSELGDFLSLDIPSGFLATKSNQRKGTSEEVLVEIGRVEYYPKFLHKLDVILNPILWRVSRNYPQNFFTGRTRPMYRNIARLTAEQLTALNEGVTKIPVVLQSE